MLLSVARCPARRIRLPQLLGESCRRFLFFGAIKIIVSAKNKSILLGGVAFLALSASANAQGIINTIPLWDGTQSIQSWGVTNTATYGQTIIRRILQPLSIFFEAITMIVSAKNKTMLLGGVAFL